MVSKFELLEASFKITTPSFNPVKMIVFDLKVKEDDQQKLDIANNHICLDIRCNNFSAIPTSYRSLLNMGLPYELPNKNHNF